MSHLSTGSTADLGKHAHDIEFGNVATPTHRPR